MSALPYNSSVLRSPFNNKPMLRKHKEATFKYRGEDYTICYDYYECTETLQ